MNKEEEFKHIQQMGRGHRVVYAKDLKMFIDGQEVKPMKTVNEINIEIEGPRFEPMTRKKLAQTYLKEEVAAIESCDLSKEYREAIIKNMIDRLEQFQINQSQISPFTKLSIPLIEPDFKRDEFETRIDSRLYGMQVQVVVPNNPILIRDLMGDSPVSIGFTVFKNHKNTMNLKTFIRRKLI